jgi:hypothetical protein
VSAPQTRAPAGEAPDTRPTPALTKSLTDAGQQAKRALLWYLATGTPAPYPGMPDWRNIGDVDARPVSYDLVRILIGLIEPGLIGRGWDQITAYADELRAVLSDGDRGSGAQGEAERMLLDAINSCAPDREAP